MMLASLACCNSFFGVRMPLVKISALALLAATFVFLSGCGSNPATTNADANGILTSSFSIENINSALEAQTSSSKGNAREYRLGTGDKIDILVYQFEELSRIYQVNAGGEIQMPLVGAVDVSRLSVVEAQQLIEQELGNYMHDPQVTIAVNEYSANEISVLGEVNSPRLYSVDQGRNPFEMLLMAGGLKSSAGREMVINVKRTESDETRDVRMVVNIESILNPQSESDYTNLRTIRDLILADGDSVYVPAAGVVYIDGAVKSPGSYDMADDTTILSLIALAGGAEWAASDRKVRVLRKIDRNTNQEYQLDLNKIRDNKEKNFKLESGDLVLVGHNTLKYGLRAFWEYGLRFLFVF